MASDPYGRGRPSGPAQFKRGKSPMSNPEAGVELRSTLNGRTRVCAGRVKDDIDFYWADDPERKVHVVSRQAWRDWCNDHKVEVAHLPESMKP